MSDLLYEKAILAYRLRNEWFDSAKVGLTEGQYREIGRKPSGEKPDILRTPETTINSIESGAGGDKDAIIEGILNSSKKDCQAVLDECLKPLDLSARRAPELFKSFKAGFSDKDKENLQILSDDAPNFVAVLSRDYCLI